MKNAPRALRVIRFFVRFVFDFPPEELNTNYTNGRNSRIFLICAIREKNPTRKKTTKNIPHSNRPWECNQRDGRGLINV